MRRRLAILILLGASAAQADDVNFRPYIVGSRAAGMGGAFTALADDGSAPYYNPGGLAFVRRSQVSLSGSVYGVVSGSNADAVRTNDRDKLGSSQNFSDLKPTPAKQLLFYVFLASAYEF